ncbi:MAG: restriction endonuclease [Bacteroidetes bacterium]|nr:restriction endonuclease [Bacteroidota bacterium]
MAIPNSEELLLPLLTIIQDEKEYFIGNVTSLLAKKFSLTEKELALVMQSGTKLFANRVAWAKSYLVFAGYIAGTRRGYFKITKEGIKFLSTKPSTLTIKELRTTKKFDQLTQKWKARRKESNNEIQNEPEIQQNPTELFETSYQSIRQALAQEILAKVKSCSPQFFEQLVVDLLVKMGYGGTLRDARAIGKSGDGGIDGIIKEDKLGLDVIYVQAKRWDNVVGRPELQKFVGALAGQGAKKGVFITTSEFTNDALNYQPRNDTKIILIDGEQLAEYMMDYDVGVSKDKSYDLKKIDYDYFEEG